MEIIFPVVMGVMILSLYVLLILGIWVYLISRKLKEIVEMVEK